LRRPRGNGRTNEESAGYSGKAGAPCHQMSNRWSPRYMRRFHCSARRAFRWSCHPSHRSINPLRIRSISISITCYTRCQRLDRSIMSLPLGDSMRAKPSSWLQVGRRSVEVPHSSLDGPHLSLVATLLLEARLGRHWRPIDLHRATCRRGATHTESRCTRPTASHSPDSAC